MTRLPVRLAAGVAALGLAFSATAVLAAPSTHDVRSIEVQYGDLDLTDTGDAARLYERIASAARSVCDQPYARDLRTYQRVSECISDAIDSAVERIDRPTLTAVHLERTSPSKSV